MVRRDFVRGAGLGLAGLATGCVPKAVPGDSPASDSSPAGLCLGTASDIEGPYYRDGVPVRSDLDLYDDEGEPLLLSGTVTGSSCEPIKGAVVEIWQANPDGEYDTESDEKRYYGQVATDVTGAYGFNTLIPGRYLNGGTYRPAHLHMKVWVDGVERLTTQIYFDGDPFNEDDGWFDQARSVAVQDGQAVFDVSV